MTEYNFSFSGASSQIIRKYGKIIRIRGSIAGSTRTDGKYHIVYIITTAGTYKFYQVWTYVVAANGEFLENINFSFDTNIDIDKEDTVAFAGDSGGTCKLFLDIVTPKSANDRQFHDQLMGIHTGTT